MTVETGDYIIYFRFGNDRSDDFGGEAKGR